MTPAVSVVLPTYQRRDWVCRAVRSVFAQRYTDWELIVVDDGSTDGTEEALRAFGPRVRYLWQENRGVSAARNAGLRLARGEIVAFLDSDDRWLPDHLQTVVAMLERHADAVLATTCPGFRVLGREQPSQTRLLHAVPDIFFGNQIGYPTGVAVRRGPLLEAGGFDERLEVGEDGDLFLRLALRGPFAVLQRRTIIHQSTSGSLVRRGAGRGAFQLAWRRMAEQAAQAATSEASFAAQAAGGARYVDGLEALLAGDRDAARAGFREACAAWPGLSRSPMVFLKRIENVIADPDERLQLFSAVASVWPEPDSDTALFMRARAIALALRLGRIGLAGRLAAGWPAPATPGFIRRTLPLWTWLSRRTLQRRVYCGVEGGAA